MGKAKTLFSRSSSNSPTFSRGKEYSLAWRSCSEGHLSSFPCLGTFGTRLVPRLEQPLGQYFLLLCSWMMISRHYTGLSSLRLLPRQASIRFYHCFLVLFLPLFTWISMSCAFMHRSLNPSKVYAMSTVERSRLKLLRLHKHQFLLGELLRTFKGEYPPSRNEVRYAFIIFLFGLDLFWHANPSMGITQLPEDFLFHLLPTDKDPSRMFTYHVKAAHSYDCTKSYNTSTSRTVGGPFMMGLLFKM